MNAVSVSAAAHYYSVCPKTIRRWCDAGKLKCSRTFGNHRRVELPNTGQTVAYARVSTADQKKDLETQVALLKTLKPDLVIQDLGSGLNYKKRGFIKLMAMIMRGEVKELMLTRKDRLLRFGSEIVFQLCRHFDVKVTIIYETEIKEPMQQFCLDVIEIMTVFSSKIYGLRAHSNQRELKKQANVQVCPAISPTV